MLIRCVEDYDSWLAKQVDDFYSSDVAEIRIYGNSFYDIIAEKPNGEEVELKNIPLYFNKVYDVTDEDERTGKTIYADYDRVLDNLEDYFDLDDIDDFDTYVEKYEDKCLPDDWKLVQVIKFADGHSIDDLEVEAE